jgi:predicted dehydrogenase
MRALRLGVIGVGHLGKEHARILSGLPDVELVGVADVNLIQATTVAQRCATKAYTDYSSLLPEVDAAVIAVPASQHRAVAAELLCRGIPVLVEKPLARNLQEADELVALSKVQDAILQVGHIERFNPAFEALQNRSLTPKYVNCERLGGYTGRSTDVGAVLDLMIHDIDLLLALVRRPVQQVDAFGLSVLGGHEDIARARLLFEDGCVADLSASRVAAAPLRRMQVWGPEGFADVDFSRRHLSLLQPSVGLCQHRAGVRRFDAATLATLKQDLFGRHLQVRELGCNTGDQLTRELQDFVHCVRTGDRPRVSGEEGREAIALAARILECIRTHRWDGREAGPTGPHAFAMPGAALFQPAGDEMAA